MLLYTVKDDINGKKWEIYGDGQNFKVKYYERFGDKWKGYGFLRDNYSREALNEEFGLNLDL